jgi:hypothetical protein
VSVLRSVIPLPTPSQDFPELLNVALDPYVADERTLAARRPQEMMPGLDMASIHIEVWTPRPVQIDRGA